MLQSSTKAYLHWESSGDWRWELLPFLCWIITRHSWKPRWTPGLPAGVYNKGCARPHHVVTLLSRSLFWMLQAEAFKSQWPWILFREFLVLSANWPWKILMQFQYVKISSLLYRLIELLVVSVNSFGRWVILMKFQDIKFSSLSSWLISDVQLPSNECDWTLQIINQHCFGKWPRSIAQQAITWANVDPDICRHMASPVHIVLTFMVLVEWFWHICSHWGFSAF